MCSMSFTTVVRISNPVREFLCGHPGEIPDSRADRDIDIGKNVFWRF